MDFLRWFSIFAFWDSTNINYNIGDIHANRGILTYTRMQTLSFIHVLAHAHGHIHTRFGAISFWGTVGKCCFFTCIVIV